MYVRPATHEDRTALPALHTAAVEASGPDSYTAEQVRAWAKANDRSPDDYAVDADEHFTVAVRAGEVAASDTSSPTPTRFTRSTFIQTTRATASAVRCSPSWRATPADGDSQNYASSRRSTPWSSTNGRPTNESVRAKVPADCRSWRCERSYRPRSIRTAGRGPVRDSRHRRPSNTAFRV